MNYLRSTLVAFVIVTCFAGCASFRTYNIPESGPVTQVKPFDEKIKLYVQETLKPQDTGEFCGGGHGCLWHGKNDFGNRLSKQLTDLGASSKFVGLTREERLRNLQSIGSETIIESDRTGYKASRPRYRFRTKPIYPYQKQLEANLIKKINMSPDEYWIDIKIRHTSDSAGKWIAKSLIGGLTLTMVPIWQEITTEVDMSVTNYQRVEIWNKKYKDSYTGLVWFFMFPMISSATAVPDDITDNIARTAVNDMIKDGIFIKEKTSVADINGEGATTRIKIDQILPTVIARLDSRRVRFIPVNKVTNDLINSSGYGDIAAVKALIGKGADVNAKTAEGMTALMVASQLGQLDVVGELISKGADVNATNNDHLTAYKLVPEVDFDPYNKDRALQMRSQGIKVQLGVGDIDLMKVNDRFESIKELLIKAGATP